jgi:hypothetical protein
MSDPEILLRSQTCAVLRLVRAAALFPRLHTGNTASHGERTMAYTVSMSAEEARNQVALGGTLLLLDAPDALVFGIDQTVSSCWPSSRALCGRSSSPVLLKSCPTVCSASDSW